jgi:nucleotide-binding universal stress UspA family protein
MKKILVPSDFSTCAESALDFALQSARYMPLEIHVLHALESAQDMYTDYMGLNKEFRISLLTEAQEKLDHLKRRVEETAGMTIHTHLSILPLKESVLEITAELGIDLIIMGTLGASGLKEKILGSRTSGLIGKTPVPVLVIPFFYVWKKPEKFLLATNHFENEPEILDFLFEIVDLFMAQMKVIVFTEEEGENAFSILEHTRKTPRYETMLKEQYHQETLTATQIFGNGFETSLQEYIRAHDIDILAMITYPRNVWSRVFHPSLTKRMSYHTKIPLLAIPFNAER